MLSRTPSPTKSPRRVALSSKDSNIIRNQQSLLKSSTTRLSPSKTSRSHSNSRSTSHSPTKPASSSSLAKNPVPSLGFVIYSDPRDYSTELALSSTLKIQDENDFLQNKENLAPLKLGDRLQTNLKRKVLGDLDINEFKGFVKLHNNHLNKNYQLDSLWNNDNVLTIPSYVTPPRNSKKVKYVTFGTSNDQTHTKSLKRSNSMGDVKEKVVKKLVFGIHKD